ncbi:hypothetical protein ACFQI7_13000 [Paenibacillus allorhizosphaerae]|uniref:TOTE conflict system primase domain-containing protein n=1 Tax=Paenibacillus allorhizosphaerae TaxID=2849866 RepID=A0ABM8VL57_9BACL|nr:hypothetical protein [Paenibacillus allorhizosphaerae]CAG7648154.1 hypothetical protein PAECIP111802_04139 [Paenibacillus allorhizosphaerae]
MQKEVIKKLSDLYIVQRGKYLSQSKRGTWRHVTAGHPNQYTKKKDIRLSDWHLENHLNGNFTIGTFAGDFGSIFMSFDVDFHDNQMAKWITYKIAYTLNSFGIDHHISFSGSKGYHIDIFFEDKITVKHARKFFDYVIEKSDVKQHTQGQVEFRVSEKQGIKLPLGIHQVTKNFCGFCRVVEGLRVMNKEQSEKYLLKITQIPSTQVLNVIEIAESELDEIDTKQFIEAQDAISPFVPLANHEQSEDYSISRAQKLLTEGLQVQGSRHNSTFLICMYLKYCGYERDDCKNELYDWMDAQNPDSYTTKLSDCYKDIDLIVRDVYEKDYNLSGVNKDLTVNLNELKWIIDKCPQKNQKLITYALLKHSKRHASMQGVFYMPFSMIASATGVDEKTARNQVNKLINLGVIEAVARNRKPVSGKGLQRHKPNLYRLNIDVIVDDSNVLTINESHDFKSCMLFFFDNKELRKLLPRKQYESLVG